MNATPDRILVVDDEVNMLALFRRVLGKEGYAVVCASSAEEALQKLDAEYFDLIISDLRMPGMSGVDLLRQAKKLLPSSPFVLLTAYATVETAVTAMKEGAYDYLTKPVNIEEIKLVVKNALDHHRLARELERLRTQIDIGAEFQNIVGRSRAIQSLLRLVKGVAKSNATILIQGESGTGKELIARAIHQHSDRKNRPFVTIECGVLPETLLESELFGHVRGAFTGAVLNKKGLFEEAHGGTIFLDEIGETTPSFQLRLLRVLQENEIRPLGSGKHIRVDVRVIAATNKDLKQMVRRQTFREDLFYRLAVVPIQIPPLRDRIEDIPLLLDHFLKKSLKENGLEPKKISPESIRRLMEHHWPGNVRELEKLIERAMLLSPGPEITLDFLFPLTATNESPLTPLPQATKKLLESVEREKIIEALDRVRGNRSHAAKLLGISRGALYKKLRCYSITQ